MGHSNGICYYKIEKQWLENILFQAILIKHLFASLNFTVGII